MGQRGKDAPWRKNLPDEYYDEERLDGSFDCAKYLGVSQSKFNKRILPRMREAGIIFERKQRRGLMKVRTRYFTYKRLVHAWLIKVGGI